MGATRPRRCSARFRSGEKGRPGSRLACPETFSSPIANARLGGKPILEQLFARFSQCGLLQLLLLLFPPRFLIFGSLFDLRAFGFDGACFGLMLLPGFIEGRLSLRDRLLPALAFPPPGSFFPQAFGFTPLLFVLKLQRGLSGGALADLWRTPLVRFGAVLSRLAPTSSPPRSVGKSASSRKRPFEPAGRLSTTPGLDMVAATTSASSVSLAKP